MKKLFLDDVRFPKDAAYLVTSHVGLFFQEDWYIVRNYDEFVQWITKFGLPDFVSFDHDLADEHYQDLFSDENWSKPDAQTHFQYDNYREKTGLDCAKWIVDWCVDNKQKLPQYLVHSANPAGRKNIQSYLDNATKHLF